MEAKKDNQKKICDISNIMETFGKYQKMQYTLICLPTLFVTMVSINYVFVVGDVNCRCRVDECEDANSTAQEPSWWPDTNIDRCSAPVLMRGEQVCTNNSFTGELTTCEHWIYESNNTVVATLDLACQPWRSNLIVTIHSTGMLLSMVVSGWMSDKFGRKPTLIFCMVGGGIGNFKTLATSYNMYVIIEFLEATLTGGSYTAALVLRNFFVFYIKNNWQILEIAGRKHRLLSGVIFTYTISFGECMFEYIAMFVPNWITLVHIINGPCVFAILLIFVVNESPRWQIVTGRIDKAKKVMKTIADVNKIQVNNEELANFGETKLKEKFNIGRNAVKESFISIFSSREIIKRLLVAGTCLFTSSFVYNGMMLNAVFLPRDEFVNFLLSTVISFPGEILSLYLMNKVGRKIPLMVGYLMCEVLCIISALTPARYLWAKLSQFLLGKVVISACFTGALTYTMELFPTNVRGSLLGLGAFASRIGCMLAPLSPNLNTVSEVFPLTFFGCLAILSGTLLILTPETMDLPLFDTIKQVENHKKEKKSEKNAVIMDISMETVDSNA